MEELFFYFLLSITFLLLGNFAFSYFTLKIIRKNVKQILSFSDSSLDLVYQLKDLQTNLTNKFNSYERETLTNQQKSLEILNKLEKLQVSFESLLIDKNRSDMQKIVEMNTRITNSKYEYSVIRNDDKFHEPVNSDNYLDVQLAFGTATVRQFTNNTILSITDIVYGTAYGSYKILVPEGKSIVIPFSDNGSPAYEGKIAIDIQGKVESFKIYYHAACFNLIRSTNINGVDTNSFRFVPSDGTKERKFENENIYDPEIEKIIQSNESILMKQFSELKKRSIEIDDLFVFVGEEGNTVYIKKATKEMTLIRDSSDSFSLLDDIDIASVLKEYKVISYADTTAYIKNDNINVTINWNTNKKTHFNTLKNEVMTFDNAK